MRFIRRVAGAAVAAAATAATPVGAQIDYRNLDDHRPVRTEDAYPIERYAFELLAPYEFEQERAGAERHLVTPELEYGVLSNTQVGLGLALAALARPNRTTWGLGGLRLFALHNLNTESRALPALAVRADLTLPVGGLAGDRAQLTLKGIGTRSWGRTRLHLNAAVTLGEENARVAVDQSGEWVATLAVDRTLLRRSLLLVAELGVLEPGAGASTEVTAAAGLRYQLTPTLVVDGGFSRRLTADAGPDLGLTFGLSHAFGIAGLMPGPTH